MKKIILITYILIVYTFSASSQDNSGFAPLFNGKDLSGWTLQKPGGFEVIDEEMVSRSFGAGTDIYSVKRFGNFILRLEFLLSDVGNSGVFIRTDPAIKESGFEVQLLAPWTPYRDDLHCTGSMYGHVAVTNRPDETTGKWYRMEISCDRNIVTVTVDNKVVTKADIDTVKTMAGKPFSGLIGFQGNHSTKGQFVKLRNIYVRDLDTEPEYVLKGFAEKNNERRILANEAAALLGAEVLDPLAHMMAKSDPVLSSGAKQAVFDIVARASSPGASAEAKKEVSVELKTSIKNAPSDIVKAYLKWLEGMLK